MVAIFGLIMKGVVARDVTSVVCPLAAIRFLHLSFKFFVYFRAQAKKRERGGGDRWSVVIHCTGITEDKSLDQSTTTQKKVKLVFDPCLYCYKFDKSR